MEMACWEECGPGVLGHLQCSCRDQSSLQRLCGPHRLVVVVCRFGRSVSHDLHLANHLADGEETNELSDNDADGHQLLCARAACLAKHLLGFRHKGRSLR